MTKELPFVSFKPIERPELPALAEMHHHIWRAAYAPIFPHEELQQLKVGDFLLSWQERVAEGCWKLYWVCRGKDKAGFIVFGGQGDEDIEIKSFYFLPAYWGKGIAEEAMHKLLLCLKMEGYRKVVLWVLEGNERARKFYNSQGFSLSAKTQSRERFGFLLQEVLMEYDISNLASSGKTERTP